MDSCTDISLKRGLLGAGVGALFVWITMHNMAGTTPETRLKTMVFGAAIAGIPLSAGSYAYCKLK